MSVTIKLCSFDLLRDINGFIGIYEKINLIGRLFDYSGSVYITKFNSKDELEKYLGLYIPNWVIGVSIENKILLLTQSKWTHKQTSMEKLIIHEFIHVVLNKLVGDIPEWINEGLAVILSKQEYSIKMNINEQTNFYQLTYNNNDFYDISATLIDKLICTYSLATIISDLKTGKYINHQRWKNEQLIRILRTNENR